MAIQNQLKQFGLNENEARVYLALLKAGPSTILNVSKETALPRTSLYYVIENLKSKGFVYENLKNKTRHFTARDPKIFEKKSKNELKKAKKIDSAVENMVASLKKMSNNPKSFSQVKHFEGKESVWEAFEVILRSNKDSKWFGFGKKIFDHYPFAKFIEDFSKKRRQFGRTKSFNVIPKFEKVEKIAKRGETDFQEFRFLDSKYDFDAGVCIFGSKIAIFSYDKELTATVLTGDAIAEIINSMFEIVWNSLN